MSDAEEAGTVSHLGDAAAAWAPSRWVRLGRWRVRYRAAGSGPPVVLVHGLGISSDYWHRNAPLLAAAGHRVLAPDLPGFGRTQGPERALPIGANAELLRRFAEAVDVGPAVWVGHSLSCQIVLRLAADHPDLARGLVLAGPTGDPRRNRQLHQAIGLLRDIPREPWRLIVDAGTGYLLAGPVLFWRTWRYGVREEVTPLLPRVAAPTRVVVGARDPVVRPAFAEMLAERLSGGRLVWVEGGTHAVHFSHPEEFNRVVLALAREVSPPAAEGAPRAPR